MEKLTLARHGKAIAMIGIWIIAIAIIVGPIFAPPEFSWIRHTTSEQAGQFMPAAWIMRTGFVAYGLGTLVASVLDRSVNPIVRASLIGFGGGLIGAAIWSNASILPDARSDLHEDFLHSIASGLVGTSFATACAARLFAPGGSPRDTLAWAGLGSSVLIPIAMVAAEDLAGLLQRAMFVVSFAFVFRLFRN